RLSFSFCFHLANSSVIALAAKAPNLQTLNLCGCKLIGDSSVKAVLQQCPKLSSLSINSCKQVTIDSMRYINDNLENLRSLSYLDVRSCPLLENNEETGALVEEIVSRTSLHLRMNK
ncbi:MAG: hypothetical protein NXI00_23300, partial [Cytophagales bacterium]|nr:hypothetical protein [Cytophagales bacterium]